MFAGEDNWLTGYTNNLYIPENFASFRIAVTCGGTHPKLGTAEFATIPASQETV